MNPAASRLPSLVLFEDDHLLVVNKPAGWNTHAPSPHAGEGIYDWLRHREARWAGLAIMHRLDKETSGVMVFAKSREASRSLTTQFANHSVVKRYLLVTDRPVRASGTTRPARPSAPSSTPTSGHREGSPAPRDEQEAFTVVSTISRSGERYVSNPLRQGGERAETHFRVLESAPGRILVEARPVTGRTHQIRVHAAAHGFPILGDALYGGTPAGRVHLHAGTLIFRHPVSADLLTFTAPPEFDFDPRLALRRAFITNADENDPSPLTSQAPTNAFRLIHGAADGWPGWNVDRLGIYLLSQSDHPLTPTQSARLSALLDGSRAHLVGAFHKTLTRQIQSANTAQASPQLALGQKAPSRFPIVENGVQFELSFDEGYSIGLFLDQRDSRRRFLANHVAAGFPLWHGSAELQPDNFKTSAIAAGAPEVLNTFAYTCGFSVCAALAGARTTSLDLSRKYLDWGRRNFVRNGLDPAAHEFITGDTFDWIRRLARKGRAFDVIVLDPPTFSRSKTSGIFRAEKDYTRLVASALPLLKPGGVLLASTNAATLKPDVFVLAVEESIRSAGRTMAQSHYVPQPPDFPITREEPGYLKTIWLRVN